MQTRFYAQASAEKAASELAEFMRVDFKVADRGDRFVMHAGRAEIEQDEVYPYMTDRLQRFEEMAKILGGCGIDREGQVTDRAGWMSAFAELMGLDKGNVSKIFSGARPLTAELEAKVLAALPAWRKSESQRHKVVAILEAEMLADINPAALIDTSAETKGN